MRPIACGPSPAHCLWASAAVRSARRFRSRLAPPLGMKFWMGPSWPAAAGRSCCETGGGGAPRRAAWLMAWLAFGHSARPRRAGGGGHCSAPRAAGCERRARPCRCPCFGRPVRAQPSAFDASRREACALRPPTALLVLGHAMLFRTSYPYVSFEQPACRSNSLTNAQNPAVQEFRGQIWRRETRAEKK